jgi:hypothetical protein
VQWATSRVQPYALAAETGYQRFLLQLPPDGNDPSNEIDSPTVVRAGRELVTDKIPEREFALKRGKLTGLSTIGSSTLPTEITVSSIRLKRRDSNLLQISWKDPNNPNAETNCKIGPSIGADNTVSHLLNLLQKENGFEVTLQVDYKPSARDMSVSFPLSYVLDEDLGHDPEFTRALKEICQRLELTLVARCVNSLETSAIAESNQWIVDNETNSTIQSAVKEAVNQCLATRKETWLHQANSEYATAKQLLESRKLAIEEERNFRHTTWTDTLKALENKLNAINNASRNALSRDSNVVR